MAPINIDLPIDENGLYITGTALEDYIRGFIPVWHFERLEQIKVGIANATEIQALVQEEQTVQSQNTALTPEQIQNAKMWEQYEFEKQIGDALVKFGLVETNPASIPTAAL
jgi:hypothetical protein